MCLTYQTCQSLSYHIFSWKPYLFIFFNSRENILYISINLLLFEIYSYLYQVFTEQPKSCHRHVYKQVQVIIWHDLTFDWFLRIIFYHSFSLTSSTGPYSLHVLFMHKIHACFFMHKIHLLRDTLSENSGITTSSLIVCPLILIYYSSVFITDFFMYVLFLPPFHNVRFTKENISLLCLFQHKL